MKRIIFLGLVLILIMGFSCKEDEVPFEKANTEADVTSPTEVRCEILKLLISMLRQDVIFLTDLKTNFSKALPYGRNRDLILYTIGSGIGSKQTMIGILERRYNQEMEKLRALKGGVRDEETKLN